MDTYSISEFLESATSAASAATTATTATSAATSAATPPVTPLSSDVFVPFGYVASPIDTGIHIQENKKGYYKKVKHPCPHVRAPGKSLAMVNTVAPKILYSVCSIVPRLPRLTQPPFTNSNGPELCGQSCQCGILFNAVFAPLFNIDVPTNGHLNMVYLARGDKSLGDLLYRIYCQYTPRSWHDCSQCSIWLNEFGSVGYVTPLGSIIHCIPVLNMTDTTGLPPCTTTMLTEMRRVTALCINDALKEKRVPLFHTYSMIGPGDRGHFCTIYPGRPPSMLAPFASTEEFYERLRAATDAMEYIRPWRQLLVDQGYPGQLATNIFTMTADNVAMAGFTSILAECFLDSYLQGALNWPINFRKLMNLIDPRTDDALFIMVPQNGWNTDCKKRYVTEKYIVKYNDILSMLHCWSSGGMLHQVLEVIKTKLPEGTFSVTQHQADMIRQALPDHIRVVHLQHKKTTLDSDRHIADITTRLASLYGITNICCDTIGLNSVPSNLPHVTFTQPGSASTVSTHTGNISMVSLCRQLLTLSSAGIHPWCVLHLPYVFSIGSFTMPVQSNMMQILCQYPCLWFYKIGSVSATEAFVTPNVPLVSLSCQPDNTNPLDSSANPTWLFQLMADHKTRAIMNAFANSNHIYDAFVPNVEYKRHLTTLKAKFTPGNMVNAALSCDSNGSFTTKYAVTIGGLPSGAVIRANITQRGSFAGELDMVNINQTYKVVVSAVADSVDNTCVICLDKPRTHTAIPCGHLSYCGVCIVKISVCSVCRANITSRVKIHQ